MAMLRQTPHGLKAKTKTEQKQKQSPHQKSWLLLYVCVLMTTESKVWHMLGKQSELYSQTHLALNSCKDGI